jgi:hypothetical protein
MLSQPASATSLNNRAHLLRLLKLGDKLSMPSGVSEQVCTGTPDFRFTVRVQ